MGYIEEMDKAFAKHKEELEVIANQATSDNSNRAGESHCAETVQPKQPIDMLRDQMELLADRSKNEPDAEKLAQLTYAMKAVADTHAQLQITFIHQKERQGAE